MAILPMLRVSRHYGNLVSRMRMMLTGVSIANSVTKRLGSSSLPRINTHLCADKCFVSSSVIARNTNGSRALFPPSLIKQPTHVPMLMMTMNAVTCIRIYEIRNMCKMKKVAHNCNVSKPSNARSPNVSLRRTYFVSAGLICRRP